jgi:RHS repeat-associated protein
VKLDIQGTSLKAYVNGTQLLNQTDSSCTSGSVGVGSVGASFEADDVRVTAPATNSCVQDWRTTTCGAFCTYEATVQSDRVGCGAYLDCYATHGCSPETCGGQDDVCGVNRLNPWGTASKEVADQVYKCMGCAGSVDCANSKYYNGTVCADGNPCTWGDTCQNKVCVPDPSRNTQCSASDQCHDVGTCDTTSGKCSNPAKPAGTVCRLAAGVCDVAEVCDGTDAGCPPDSFLQASMTCRPSAGVCDPAETCSGTSPSCPDDVSIGPPAKPTGVVAAPGTQQVALSWSGSADAKSFTIKRGTASGGPYSIVAAGIKGTYSVNTGLIEGTPYYYVITAVSDCGESTPSAEVSAVPAIVNQLENSQATIMLAHRRSGGSPPDLRIAVPGLHTVWIEWDSVVGADNYAVSRMSGSNAGWLTFSEVPAVDGQTTYDLQDTEVASPGSTVCYSIDATAAGVSLASTGPVCVVIPNGNEAFKMTFSNSTMQGGTIGVKTSSSTGDSYVDAQLVGAGDSFETALGSLPTNAYNVRLTILKGPDRGKFQLQIEGKNQGVEVDGYATTEQAATVDLGLFDHWAAGTNIVLTFTSTGSNTNTYSVGLISAVLTPLGVRGEAEYILSGPVTGGTASPEVAMGQASANALSALTFDGIGSFATYKINVPSSGKYRVLVRYRRGVDQAKWQISIDPNAGDTVPTVLNVVHGFSTTPDYQVADLGIVTLTLGQMNEDRNFKLAFIGSDPQGPVSRGAVIDYIDLRNVVSDCGGEFNATSCDDGNACTTNDQCNSDFCTGGPPLSCDDHDDCTVDYCDPASGCKSVYSPPASSGCNVLSTNVTPILNCIATSSDGTFRAIFGYTNNTAQNISIPSYDSSNRIQRNSQIIYDPIVPGWFPVGQKSGVLIVPFASGENVSWTIGANAATASQTSPVASCTINTDGTITESNGTTFSLPGPQTAAYQATATQIVNTSDGFSSPAGKTNGTFAVTDDGSATYHIPLWVPPGRGGVQPKLSLDYSSSDGDGIMGVGWHVGGLPRIMRCPSDYARDGKRREIRFDDQDKLCLDGQRLVLVSGQYNHKKSEYRTEIDSHVKIVQIDENDFGPTGFVVYLPDGTIEGFGNDLYGGGNATIEGYQVTVTADQSSADAVPVAAQNTQGNLVLLGWGLASIQDRYGNSVLIDYIIDESVIGAGGISEAVDFRPSEIAYNWVSSVGGWNSAASIRFEYDTDGTGPRQDIRSSFVYGLPMKVGHLLTEIKMTGPNPNSFDSGSVAMFRAYKLHYINQPARALLDSVTECDGKWTCLPPTQFGWTPSVDTFTRKDLNLTDTVDFDVQTIYPPGEPRFENLNFKAGDYNGDGLDDILLGDKLIVSTMDSSGNWGFQIPAQPDSHVHNDMNNPWDYIYAVDINADGMSDPMWRTSLKKTELGSVQSEAYCPGLSQWTDGAWTPQFNTSNPESCPNLDGVLYGKGQIPPYVGDFDGDGLPDLVRAYWPADVLCPYWSYVPNSPSGFASTTLAIQDSGDYFDATHPGGNCNNQGGIGSWPTPGGVDWTMNGYMVDINGDGKLEFLFWDDAFIGTTPGILGTSRMRLFNGPASGPLPTTLKKSIPSITGMGPDLEAGCKGIHYQFADVNGDGLVDAIEIPNKGGDIRIAINTGRDFLPPVAMNLSTNGMVGQSMDVLSNAQANGRKAIDPGLRIVDINSDGRSDVLLMGNACRNIGNGGVWNPGPAERTHLVAAISQPTGVGGAVFSTSELINSSSQPIALGDKTVVSFGRFLGEPDCGGGYGMSVVLDLNGDGLADMVQLEGTQETNTNDHGSQLITPGKLVAYIRNGQRPGMLSSVKDGLGNKTQVTYAALSDSTVYSKATSPCTYPQYCKVRGKWVVKSHTLAYNSPTALTFSHKYVGAREDITGIGWLGMDNHTVTDTSNQNTTIDYYDHINRVNNLYPHGGLPQERLETFQIETGQQIQKHTSHICGFTSDTTTGRVYATSCSDALEESETEPSTPTQPVQIRKMWTIETYDPTFGSPTSRTTDVGVSSSQDLHERSTWTPTYWNSGNEYDSWLIGLVWKEQQTSSVPASAIAGRTQMETKTRSIEYMRDANTGAVTNIYVEPSDMTGGAYDPNQYRAIAFDRNSHGQIVKTTESTVSGTRTTNVTYDPITGIFPSTVTNSLGQMTSTIYHPGLGVLLQATDPNGLVSTFEYDGLGRPRKETSPKGDITLVNYRSTDNNPYIVDTYIHGNFIHRGDYYSAQGRKTEVHATDENYQDFIAQTITYDSHGRVIDVRRPAYSGSALYGTSIGYDAMGRPTYKTDGVGYKSWSYLQNTSTQITRGPTVGAGTVDQQETTIVDELGRVIQRSESVGAMPIYPDGSGGGIAHSVTTSYVYGPFGVLEDVVDGNTMAKKIHTDYDNLGRAKSSSDLDRGTWTRVFDGFGQLREEKQIGGPDLSFTYDLLGRKTSEATAQGKSTFLWDLAPSGVGKLVSTSSADGVTQEFFYDAYGELSAQVLGVNGESLRLDLSYDSAGRPSGITYPAVNGTKFSASYTYSQSTGELISVTDPSGDQMWHVDTRNLDFLPTSETFGDKYKATRSYEPQRGYLTAQTAAKASGEGIASIAYTYDVRGYLDTRSNYFTGVAEKFTHDELGRLRHWSDQAKAWSLHYDYDDLGNMTSRTWKFAGGAPDSVTTYAPKPGAGPNELGYETIDNGTPREYFYDPAGRQISGPDRTVTYTDFDLPITIKQQQAEGEVNWSFKYDANHGRVLKASDGGTNTLYFGGLYERRTSTTHLSHIMYVPGARGAVVAQVTQNEGEEEPTIEYLHDDPIGSPAVITSSSVGNTQLGFEPFGQRAHGTGPTPPGAVPPELTIGFGGHEQEEELGLINMGGRIYDPKQARFLTADPLLRWPLHSQSYNPYSYAMNSPFRFVDPTGFGDEDLLTELPDVPQLPEPPASEPPAIGQPVDYASNTPDPYRDLGLGFGHVDSFSASDTGAESPVQGGSLDSSIGSGATNGTTGFWDHPGALINPSGQPIMLAAFGGLAPEAAAQMTSTQRAEYNQRMQSMVLDAQLGGGFMPMAVFAKGAAAGVAATMAAARFVGLYGQRIAEEATGLIENTERIVIAGQTRVPDLLSRSASYMGEVKNVGYQALTSQLRDFMTYAIQRGYTFDLFVRSAGGTQLSRPLLDAVSKGLINIKEIIPPLTSKF